MVKTCTASSLSVSVSVDLKIVSQIVLLQNSLFQTCLCYLDLVFVWYLDQNFEECSHIVLLVELHLELSQFIKICFIRILKLCTVYQDLTCYCSEIMRQRPSDDRVNPTCDKLVLRCSKAPLNQMVQFSEQESNMAFFSYSKLKYTIKKLIP